MNHLIVYAHPSKKSFSHLLKEKIAEESGKNGYNAIVRDLYEMNFNPVLSPDDLKQLKQGQIPEDIKAEQELVAKSDLITFIFPLWWAGYPAIIKGYIDRVFAYGFAYDADNKWTDGLLKGKKAWLFTSMGNTIEEYHRKNMFDSFKQTLGHEIFDFCGIEVVHHQFFPQIPDASEDTKLTYAEDALKGYNLVWPVSVGKN